MASFLQRLFGNSTASSEPIISKLYSSVGTWINYGAGAAPRPTMESALESTAVLACVKVITEGVSSLPIRLMKREKRGNRTINRIASDHWAHRLLAVRPNSYMTAYELQEFIVVNCLLSRGALLLKARVGNEIRELHPVMPGAWSIEVMSDSTTRYRVTFAGGHQQLFKEDDVIFFKGLSLDGRIGVDVLEKARTAIGINNALERQNLNTAANMGRPSGVLSFTDSLTPEKKDALRTQWAEKFGPNSTGGIAILDSSASFQQMSLSLVDSQFLESRKFAVLEISRVFRVQPSLIMANEGTATFASVESHNRNHFQNCIYPWVARFEQTLNKYILNDHPDFYYDYDETLLLRGNNLETIQYIQAALGNGGTPAVMTISEAREYLGLDQVDDPRANSLFLGGYNQDAESIPVDGVSNPQLTNNKPGE